MTRLSSMSIAIDYQGIRFDGWNTQQLSQQASRKTKEHQYLLFGIGENPKEAFHNAIETSNVPADLLEAIEGFAVLVPKEFSYWEQAELIEAEEMEEREEEELCVGGIYGLVIGIDLETE